MPDVFVSYARSTETAAQMVVEALRARGYDVWLDQQLPAHRAYADVIEEQLRAAKSVVVIWSADAARSEWVRSEAELARGARKLVQVRVDPSRLPMPFDQIQCADLSGWTGEADAPAWRQVVASIAELVAAAPDAATQIPTPDPTAVGDQGRSDRRPAARSDSGSTPVDPLRRLAARRADAEIRFRKNAVSFVAVNAGLAVLNLVTTPHQLWFQYVLAAWGLGLAIQGLKTYQTLRGDDREAVIARKVAQMQRSQPPPP